MQSKTEWLDSASMLLNEQYKNLPIRNKIILFEFLTQIQIYLSEQFKEFVNKSIEQFKD